MKRRVLLLAAGALLLCISTIIRSAHRPAPPPPSHPVAAAPGEAALRPPPDTADPAAEVQPEPPSGTPPRSDLLTTPPPERPLLGLEDFKKKDPARPRVVLPETNELLIFLKPDADPQAFARDHGIELKHSLRGVAGAHVFATATPAAAKAARQRALLDPRVARAFLNERTQHIHCAFVPNDPYYPNGSPVGFPGQWHLGNGATPNHANVVAAWNRDFTGAGVLLGIVDDCLQTAHPDLAPNYVAADSWNFGNNSPDPNPNPAYDGTPNEDRHGTSVSGVAAARGGNGIGTTGAAPLGGLAGLRVDFPNQLTSMFVNATLYHSSAGNTNIKIKNHSYGIGATYIPADAENQAVTDSAAVGTIHLYAAGNERTISAAEDSNKTQPQNNPDAITVAALGSDGKFAWYSSYGANIFVTAPSSGISGFGITTTDRTGNRGYNRTGTGDGDSFPDTNYTSTFGGTSSATPLTAGIMALGKQARPTLDVRFAKHALARSCTQNDPTDGTATGGGSGAAGSAWKTNAAGFKFNQNYGFGLVNADQFVQKLLQFDGVTAMGTESVGTTAVGAAIPDFPGAGVSRTFALASTTPLEEIQVTLDITHTYRGDLEAYLTSPSGTTRRLFMRIGDNQPDILWTFVSNEFWGENPAGTWTLLVQDFGALDIGTWNSYAVTARTGTVIADTTPPSVVSITRASANPTNAGSVSYTVTFSEPVTGVDAGDFALTTTGTLSGTSVTAVTGSLATYTITVNTGSGDGTLRLDVADNDTIQDTIGNRLGGTGIGNGSFTSGQVYTIDKTASTVSSVSSTAANGAYMAAAGLPLTVTFSESVLVTGTPQLRLATGGAGSLVNYSSGSGSATLTFNYVVAAGHNSPDLDYFSTAALTLNGGTIRDAAGNNAVLTLFAPGAAGSLGANKNLVIDTTLPGAPGTPGGLPNPNTGTFLVSWSAASDGTGSGIANYTVQRSDNAGPFNTIATGVLTTSLSQTALAQGSYRYQAFALDVAGNSGPTSGISAAVTVDTTPPAAPSTPDLAAASDSGTSSTDNITNLTSLTFSGSAEAGASVQIFVDGVGGASGPAAGGAWTLVVPSIGAGVHSITARATDGAGNIGAFSGALSVTVDLSAPVSTTPDLAAASDTGASSTDDITNLTSLTFTGSAEAGSTVQLFIDGAPGATTIAAGGVWTLSASGLSPGLRLFTSRATDIAGNLGPVSGSLSVTIDTTLPAAPSLPDLAAASDSGTSGSDNITNLTTLTFSGTAEPGSSVQLFVDGIAGATTTAAGGAWTLVAPSIAPGIRLITARATNVAGNLGPASATLSVTVDTTAPAAPSAPDLTAATDTGTSASDNITSSLAPAFVLTGEPGGTLTLFAGLTPVGTAGDSGGGTYALTIDATAMANSTVTFTARITDAAGNVGALSAGLAVTFDTTAPATSIPDLDLASDSGASGTDDLTNLTTLSFSGSAEAGATVQIFVDGAPGATTIAAGGVWTLVAPSLTAGVRLITARATDAAGNLGAMSGVLAVTIDLSPPAAPSTPDLAAASDSGASSTDNITNLTTLSFSGTAEPGSSVQLFVDGIAGATATAAGGAWTIIAPSLAPGPRSITARATDPAGNLGPASPALSVTIDTTPPVVPIITLITNDTGPSNSDGITSDNQLDISGSAEAGITMRLLIDGVPGPTTTAAGGAWSFSTPVLADGPHTLTVIGTDAAGNDSPAASRSVVIDTSAPAAPTTPDLDPASDSGTSNTDNITSVVSPTFNGTAEAGASVQLFVDGVAGPVTTAAGGAWTLVAPPLAAGVRSITARATDLAGNASPFSPALSVTIDVSAPSAPSAPDLAAASDSGTSNTDNITSVLNPTITMTAEAGGTMSLFKDGVAAWSATDSGSGTYVFTIDATSFANSSVLFTAKLTDLAGNVSPFSPGLSVTFDSSAPAAPSVPDLDAASDSGVSSTDNLTNLTTLSFSGTAEAGATVQLLVDGIPGATTTAAGGTWTIVASSMTAGVHSISARASDAAGNLGVASAALPVTIDTSAPAAPSAPDLVAASDSGTSSTDNITSVLTPTFLVTGEAGGVAQLFADGILAATAAETTPGNYFVTVNSGIADGNNILFTAKIMDAAGNTSAFSASGVQVLFDATAPAVPSIPDLAAASDSGVSSTDNLTNLTVLSFSGTADAGSTVQLFVNGVPGATTTAAGGNWTIGATLIAGTHSITARSSDAAGNLSAPSGALSVTVDLSPPGAPTVPDLDAASDSGTSSTDNLTNLTTLSFSGTAESGASVQLVVDSIPGAAAIAAGGAWTIAATLTPGTHLVAARATDAAGNVGALSGALPVTVDTTPPPAPSAPDLDAASDTGISNTDNITSLTTLSFSGTAETGAGVQIFVDGVPGASTTAASGAWTIVATLTAGTHSVTARATDAAGNLGPLSTALSVTVDTTLPTTPSVPDLDVASDTGISSSDNLTSTITPAFTGTAEIGALVKLFANAVQVGSATAGAGGAWTIISSALADGTYLVTATATDSAGNASPASAGLSVTIDTSAPAAPSVPDLSAASDSGASSTDNRTNLTTVSLSGTAEPGSTVQLFANGAPGATVVAAAGTGAWTIVAASLAEGPVDFTARARDAAGNLGPPSAALQVIVDTTPPAAPSIPDLDAASDSGASNTDNITKLTTLSFSGTAEIGASVQLFVDGVPGATSTATAGAWTIVASPVVAGTHAITARVTDLAGNVGPASAPLSVTVDTSAPPAPSIPDLDAASDTGASNSDNLTRLTTLSFSGSAEPGSTVQLLIDGSPGATVAAAAGGGWTLVAASLTSGVHGFAAQTTDAAGNVSPASAALSVTIDTTAPAAPSAPDLAAADDSGASSTDNITKLTTLSFSGTAEIGASVQLFVDGAPGATAIAGAGGAWTLAATSLAEGVRTITAVATDPAGNAGPASAPLLVTIDLSAPPAPAAPDLDAASDTGTSSTDNITKLTVLSFSGSAEAGATVRLLVDGTPVGLTTAAGGAWTLSASGVAEGVHLITATATDVAGNASAASAPLSVTVDTTPPAAPSVPDLDAASDTGASSTDNLTSLTTLSFSGTADPGSTVQLFVDGVAGATTTAIGGTWTLSASSLASGARSITARATDAAGNPGPLSGALTVTIDSSAPAAPSVPDLDAASDTGTSNTDNLTKLTTLSFSGTAESGSTVRLLVDGVSAGTATAAGGAWTIIASLLAPGPRTITATALDPAGNLSPASAGLVVTIDTTPPPLPAAPVLDAASDTGASATDRITTIHLLSFTGTTEAGATVQLYANAALVGTIVAGPGGGYTAGSSFLADGAYDITVTATDAAGNVSAASAPIQVIIDNSAPPAGVVQDGPGADINFQNSATTIAANWSGFVDPLSGILRYEVSIGTTPGGAEIEAFVDVGTATSVSRGPFALVEGATYFVTVRATNPLNLQSTATSDGVKVDTIAPAPAGALLAIPADQAATLYWTASPSPDSAFYRVWWKPASAAWAAATMVDNLPGVSATVPGLVNGVLYDFRLAAVDAAGNESTDRFASTTPHPAIQIQGGGTFATIQAAIDAALPGQTVLIGPGTYVGDIVLHAGVSLQGWSPGFTILQGSGLGPVITVEGTFGLGLSSTISQLTVTGGLTGISSASADLTIQNAVIHHVLGDGISAGAAGRLALVNGTVMSNTGDGVRSLGATVVRNTIVGSNGGFGLNLPGAATVTYSDAYGNAGGDYSVGAGATGNLSTPAIFTNAAGTDYTTTALSPTADAGDPADDFSGEPVPNGGRIDMGAYGNTIWAALTTTPVTTAAPPGGGGGGGGGGCGLLGLEAVVLLALLQRKRR